MDALLSSFLHLLHDTETSLSRSRPEYHSLSTFLRDFRLKRVTPLFRRCRGLQKSRYTISLVGLTNVGKSTLAHALLEHPVAPRRNSPATSMPVEYEFGQAWSLTVHSSASQSVVTSPFPSPALVSTALARYVFDDKAAAEGRISRIIVTGPMDLLAGGVVFADTPGFGSARPGAAGNHDKESLVAYIAENVDEVIFCVSGDSFSLLPEEQAFFEAIQQLCSTVVVTKALAEESDDIDAVLRRFRTTFQHKFPLCEFMFVEAKWAIAKGVGTDDERYEASRVAAVRDFIKDRGTVECRFDALRSQVERAWRDLVSLARPVLRESGVPAIPWRRDSWAEFAGQARQALVSFSEGL